MNAYELAQYLEVAFYPDEDIAKTAVMLRRQADEITVLHKILGYEGVAVGQDYLDECVAELRKASEK